MLFQVSPAGDYPICQICCRPYRSLYSGMPLCMLQCSQFTPIQLGQSLKTFYYFPNVSKGRTASQRTQSEKAAGARISDQAYPPDYFLGNLTAQCTSRQFRFRS